MTVLASLIGVLGSKGTSDMEYDPSGFNITIPLKDIITRATKDASSEHADELSSTITEGIAINGSYKHREVRSESTEKSIARSGSFTKSFLLDRKSHVDLTFKPSTRPSFSVRLGFNTDDEDSKYWHNSMWSALDGKEIDESNVAVELSAAACLTAHSESNEGNNDLLDGITAFAEFDSDGQSEVSCDTENIDSSNMEAIRQALLDQINEQISR